MWHKADATVALMNVRLQGEERTSIIGGLSLLLAPLRQGTLRTSAYRDRPEVTDARSK
jgi:hypothetical protein